MYKTPRARAAGKVKCVEYLVVDAMREANAPLRIAGRIDE